jgi:hypothetical protein
LIRQHPGVPDFFFEIIGVIDELFHRHTEKEQAGFNRCGDASDHFHVNDLRGIHFAIRQKTSTVNDEAHSSAHR